MFDSALAQSPETLAVLFVVGLVAGLVDSIAGGGGLLTVPGLLWAGLPPAAALATNKLQSSFGSFSATLRFTRSGEADPREMVGMIVCTLVGAAAGTSTVQVVDSGFLRAFIPFLLIGIAVYLIAFPKAGDMDSKRRMSDRRFAVLIGGSIGFYDGFFGPGTGTFFAIAFVSLLGADLRAATAKTKVLNFASNIAALLFFLLGGKIVWIVGLVMGVGQYLGARAGAGLVLRSGARIVRPMLVAASLAVTARIVWTDEDGLIRGAVGELLRLFS